MAWGKRRFTDGTSDNTDSLVGLTTDRGYTEHEMLDELGIIHMNGRIYDPYIGRFMSADPIIQDPYELQSHNRYSYVMNNPLFYTDPSGYSAWNRFRDNVLKPVVVIAVTYYTGNVFGTSIWGVIGSGAAGGATGALLNGGNFKQVLQGAAVGGLSSALFYGAGKIGTIKSLGGEYGIGHYAAHAVAGCVSTVAGGGECGAGAASAVVGKAVTQFTSGDHWNQFTRGVAVSVGGGLASVAGGGTFANGATTAAYGYLFNECTSKGKCFTTDKEKSLLAKNDYLGYYAEACGAGDTYACQAHKIAEGKTIPAIITTARLSEYLYDANRETLVRDDLKNIRIDLAHAHANYLGYSLATAKELSAIAIAEYHWKVFSKYDVPPRAFGGTPFGTLGYTMFEKKYPFFIGGGTGWCPKCKP
jgi:RHS repeat-associated protein